jgi:2',5'-phosphodiesterase
VVSYNILADLYADSEVSRKQLFPYCPPYALNIDYRKQLIMKELLGESVIVLAAQALPNKILPFTVCIISCVLNKTLLLNFTV